jgi:hypothetical protein
MSFLRRLFRRWRRSPLDLYQLPDDFDPSQALAFTRESAPPAWLAVMSAIQDRLADATNLASAMATAKEPGYQAHAAGQLCALVELYDDPRSQAPRSDDGALVEQVPLAVFSWQCSALNTEPLND